MEAPYVNKIGPGQHSFINQFEQHKVHNVNKYQNSPSFSFPKVDYWNKIDYRYGQSPTRLPYTSSQAFREKVDKNYLQTLNGQSSPDLLHGVTEQDLNDEHTRNLAMSQMVHQAFVKFGNQKGSASPKRLTQTQTFSKEEKGVVHILYDPDFKDNSDFRQDLRKVALSPGPGAHTDPLQSFKNVVHKPAQFSFPKVSALFNSHLTHRAAAWTSRQVKDGTVLAPTCTNQISRTKIICNGNLTSICSLRPGDILTPVYV